MPFALRVRHCLRVLHLHGLAAALRNPKRQRRGHVRLVRGGLTPSLTPLERLILGLLLPGLLLASSLGRAQDTLDARLVAGLLQRQLFELAEHHCQAQLARSDLEEARRIDLTLQLVRAVTLRAMNAPPEQRASLWPRADDAVRSLATAVPKHPLLTEVELELQWCRTKQGEVLRLEAELQPDPDQSLDKARDTLRQAIRALQNLREAAAPGGLHPAAPADGTRSMSDRQRFRSRVEFTLGEAFRQQALCYEDGSPDQVHLLTRALDLHNSVARLSGNSDMSLRSHLAEIQCLRRLRRFDTAADRLQQLQQRTLDEQDHLQMAIEHAGLLIDTGRMEMAVQQLLSEPRPREAAEELLARADLTLMEALVALWRDAARQSNSKTAGQWQRQAMELLRNMEQSRSAYWVRRAELLLTPTSEAAAGVGDLQLLQRAAEHMFQQQDYAEAVGTYARAASLARELGDDQQAFRLTQRSAAIRRQIGDHAAAMPAFRQLALSFPRHESASQAHLLAITSAATLARDTPGQLPAYADLLREHLSQWPHAPTANQVRFWYGNLKRAQGQLHAALDLWMQIDSSFSQFDQVLQSVRSDGLQLLQQAEVTDRDRQDTASQIARFLEQTFLEQTAAAESWTHQQQWAAVEAARLRVLWTSDDLQNVAGYLTAALESAPETSPSRATIRALLGLSLLRSQLWTEAREQFSQVDWADVRQPLLLLIQSSQHAPPHPGPSSPEEARIRVEVGRQLQALAASWPIDEQQRLALYRAQALTGCGDTDEALAIFESLVVGRPHDSAVLQSYAQCLQNRDARADLLEALSLWRRVARLNQTATPSWFEAKLAIARLHSRLGNRKRAAEVIRLTQALHPDLGGPRLKQQFLQTLRDCEAAR